MKKISVATVFLLIFSCIIAQTRIKDKQEVFGTWEKSKSPYIIEGEAIVPVGKTLRIKPGTVIKFKTGTNWEYSSSGRKLEDFDLGFLRINGKIVAKGKKDQLIIFTRNDSTGNWGNIHIKTNNKGNIFTYCKFEYSLFIKGVVSDDNATGALSFLASTGKVKHCLFLNSGWAAVNCKQGANPILANLTIVGYEYGIECNYNSSPTYIKNIIIWNVGCAFYNNSGKNMPLSYSLIQGGTLPDEINDEGNNILGKAPEFIDPANGNYGLKKSSPAYKKGKDGKNIGAL